MSHIPFHPAPGFGDLLAGSFIVPQNPIRDVGTPLVPSVQATAPNQVIKLPALADLVRASFAVPQNPLIANMPTLAGLRGCAGIGCGCAQVGCDGGRDFYALNGLGDDAAGGSGFSMSGITDWLTAPSMISSIPNWALYGGAAALAWIVLMPGGSEYREKAKALRSQYRGYRRAAGAVGQYA